MKRTIIFFLLALIIGCTQANLDQSPQQIEMEIEENMDEKIEDTQGIENKPVAVDQKPSLKIIFPADNDLIKSENVSVVLQAGNFRIVDPGKNLEEGEGHFHVWLDSVMIVTKKNRIIFQKVFSGKRTITAELVNSDHSSLNPKVIQTITINVESVYSPIKEINSSIKEIKDGTREFEVEADDNGFYPDKLKAKIGEKVRINFKFRDNSIYYAGMDVKGPFEDIAYKQKDEQPVIREFIMKDETRITSYWPASGVRKGNLIVEIEK